MKSLSNRSTFGVLALALMLGTTSACMDPNTAANQSKLSPEAKRWLDRAQASYHTADMDDARDSVQSALAAAPKNPEVKLVAARIHLARLEYAEVNRVLQGEQSSAAHALRGRAHWYAGEVEAAADELEALLADAQVHDEWAKAIAQLARKGAERKPFQVSGGLLTPVPMPRVRGTHLIVPLEIDGEQGLALLATERGEVVLDSTTRKSPSWVQLRFGERIEVSNVPAMVEDLSGISREVGAPIKALLGVNLLRRLNVTFDFGGEQFVVRTREPSPPPKATRVSLAYAQGGLMVTRVALSSQPNALVPVVVNTQMQYPVALDDRGWKAAGVSVNALTTITGEQNAKVKSGVLPAMRIGAFDIPHMPAVYGPSFTDLSSASGMDLEGAIGSGLLANFRCTLTEGGRAMWMEDLPQEVLDMLQHSSAPAAAPSSSSRGAPPSSAGASGASANTPAGKPLNNTPPTAPIAAPARVAPPAAQGPAEGPKP